MPILSDREHAVIGALGLWLEQAGHPAPAIVVFDACGRPSWRHVGRSGADRPEGELLRVIQQLFETPPNCQVA
jgi:hypothetical protein